MQKIEAKTPNQQTYIDAIKENKIVFCDGPAGTGKSIIATLLGIYGLIENKYDKIVISRSLVQADSPTGYLPGTAEEKLGPYIRPVMDVIHASVKREIIEKLKSGRKIDIVPFGLMRGLTFHNTYIIFDECQNCTFDQLILGITRLGRNSKMVISGDSRQSDLPLSKQGGMAELMAKLDGIKGVGTVYLGNEDIVREPIVRTILEKLDEKKET